MRRLSILFFLLVLSIIYGCAQPLILLSPEDLYALGSFYLDNENYANASEQFESIRQSYPTSEYGTMSQYKLAETKLLQEKYDEAAIEFELFVEFHPAHKLAPQARLKMAMCKFHSLLSPDRDITMAHEALMAFDQFIRIYPDHPDMDKVRDYRERTFDHIMIHDLEAGLVYYRRKAYNAAINRIKPVADSAISRPLKARAGYYLARCYEKRKKFDAARTSYQVTIDLNIPSEYIEKARKRLTKLPEPDESQSDETPEQLPIPRQP